VGRVADRLVGSPQIYGHEGREAEQSVNFVTCHDGFTLNDLVSYDRKHNEANGEDNRDGANDNLSWNCGIEGPTGDAGIEALRNRQVKNFLVLNLIAVGTPMLLMGDEARRSQQGNNNAYCQDHALSWFDWDLVERHSDIWRFVKGLNAFRQRRALLDDAAALTLNQLLARARLQWHGVALDAPDWNDYSHSLAFTIESRHGRIRLHGILNAYWEPLSFALPAVVEGRHWRRCIDTAQAAPDDIRPLDHAPLVTASTIVALPRSIVVLAQVVHDALGAPR
jgi:glycogen operon protein